MLGDGNMLKSDKKVIPLKNYVYLAIILVVSIFIVYYFYLWYRAYDESKLSTPIMDEYLQVINYNELKNYIIENRDAFVYVSVVNDVEIRDFEKKFKSTVSEYSLKNEMLYLNLSNEFNDEQLAYDVNKNYKISEAEVPLIMVFENGELIDSYSIRKHDYKVSGIVKYLTKMGLINND